MSKAKKTAKQVTPAEQTPVSIPVQDLKDRFKARSIPLETDFADMIDVADCGRKAVGLSPDFVAATDTGLELDSNGQLRVADNYVTKTGDSTITGGSLNIANYDEGISFYGGSRIFHPSGSSSLRWYKGTNNVLPQICDNDGSNASNIATESYVNGSGKSGDMSGELLAFEIGAVNDYWPVDIDFTMAKAWTNCGGILSGRASAVKTNGTWWAKSIIKEIDDNTSGYPDIFGAVKLFKNNTNGNLAIGVEVGADANQPVIWRVRVNGGTLINIAQYSFSGYTELASA